jgi:hypothetical protein
MTAAHENDNAWRAARAGIVLAGVAVSVVTALWFLDVYALGRGVAMFDLGEGGLITWSSVAATIAVAVIALLLSFVDPFQRVRGVLLALGLAYISFDDAVVIHERLATGVAEALGLPDDYSRVLYPLVLFPLLLMVAYLLLELGRTDPLALRFLLAGLAGLVIGVGVDSAEIVYDALDVSEGSWLRVVGVTITEGAELAGWILIATGAAIRLIGLYEPRPEERAGETNGAGSLRRGDDAELLRSSAG